LIRDACLTDGFLEAIAHAAPALERPLVSYRGLSGAEAHARARELLETVELSPPEQFESKRPHQLSRGQLQRVVARALAPEPEIIIADKPISMLDALIRTEILITLDRETTGWTRNIATPTVYPSSLCQALLADCGRL
jgi:peptide/nickel transport system ATP-binding protein